MGYYESVYSRVDYRVWLIGIPLIALLLLPSALNVKLGIDFTGGTEIQIVTERSITASQFESVFEQCGAGDMRANVQNLEGRTTAILKTTAEVSKECADQALSSIGFTPEDLNKVIPTTFRPELGATLMEQGSRVFIMAGILMMIVVFVAFRSIIPSIAVIQAAALDIIIGLGALSMLGFEMGLAGFAALLMLIGYSVDDNIVLTSNVLKERGKPIAGQVNQAFATGITMTGTSVAAMIAIIIVSSIVQIETINQIALVLVAGLLAGFFTTWFVNVAVLEWYLKRAPAQSKKSRFSFRIFRS